MRGPIVAVIAFASACQRSPGPPIIVEGTIQTLRLTGPAPAVVLRANGRGDVECRFPSDRVRELSKLAPAQWLRLHGTPANAGSALIVEHSAIEWAGRKPGANEDDDDD